MSRFSIRTAARPTLIAGLGAAVLSGAPLEAALRIERTQGEPLRPKLEQARLSFQEADSLRDQLSERFQSLNEKYNALQTERSLARPELTRLQTTLQNWQDQRPEQGQALSEAQASAERLRQSVAGPLAELTLAKAQQQDDATIFRLEALVQAMLAELSRQESIVVQTSQALSYGQTMAQEARDVEAQLITRLAEIDQSLITTQAAREDVQTDLEVWQRLTDEREQDKQHLEQIIEALTAEAGLIIRPPSVGNAQSVALRTSRAWPVDPEIGTAQSDNNGRVMPIEGEIISVFGETLEAPFDQGILIQASAGSRIIAPYSGQVVFAGPFQRYGQLLIIDHGDGYHTLLSGFDWLGVSEGVKVEAGQLVGSLASDKQGNSRLYLELRRRGKPANPLPWLAASSDKVRG